MGKELDLAGVWPVMTGGKIKRRQIYKNIIDGTTYISNNFMFVQVFKKGDIYVERRR